MSLKAKFKLSTSLGIVLAILLSMFLVFSSHQTRRTGDNEARAVEIVETISHIRFVTFENLLHHDERSFEQWQSKHADLIELLKPRPNEAPAERKILDNMLEHAGDVNLNFNNLVASYNGPKANQNVMVHEAYQDRLATQILTKQQSQISDALSLSTIARAESAKLRTQTNVLVALVIASMLLLMAVNFFFVTGTISRALTAFRSGAEKIAGGDFGYRISTKNQSDELGRLATAFNSMAASLEKIDTVKSDFILLASHQLRTPLTAIKWTSEVLTLPNVKLDAKKQQRYIKQIHDSNERMIALVRELLDATKIGLGKSPSSPESVQLDPIVDQVIQDLSALMHHNKIKVIKKIDSHLGTVIIDPSWMRIIIQNLLSNAIKYSPPGENVTITIQRHEANLAIKVADKGCGIPENQQIDIFTKLFRADNAKRIIGEGSGLGLYISKALVEQFGGAIWFDSVEDRGSTFYVKLPLENSKPA